MFRSVLRGLGDPHCGWSDWTEPLIQPGSGVSTVVDPGDMTVHDNTLIQELSINKPVKPIVTMNRASQLRQPYFQLIPLFNLHIYPASLAT